MSKRFFFSRPAALLAVGLALWVAPVWAQTIDPTFTPPDMRAGSPHSKGNAVQALATDPAGRVLMGGAFDLLNGQPRGGVQRLLANGQPDPTFGAGGVGTNGNVNAIWPLPNGQYLIGGTFTRYDGQPVGRMARLNANGSLDAAFNASIGSGANAVVKALATDAQGRIVVGGYFNHFDGHAVPGLVRLLPNGAYDPSFAPPVYGYEAYVYALAIDASDRVIVGGDVYPGSSSTTNLITVLERLLPATGAADPTFVPDTLSDYDYILRVRALPGGKVLVGGLLPVPPNQNSQGVRRLNADGSTDTTFVSPFAEAYVRDVASLPNGQILIVGSFYVSGPSNSARVARLLPSGTLDTTLVPPTLSSSAGTILPGPAGSMLVGGRFMTVNGQTEPGLTRLASTGTPDAAFSPPTFATYATLTGLSRQSNDRLLAAGNFGTIGGVAQRPLVRFSANGALDPSFQLDPSLVSDLAYSSTLVVGQADRIISTSYDHVFRLLPDGARDATFDDGAGQQSGTTFIGYGTLGALEQPDGRLLVWGGFTRYNGEPRVNVARLLPTGAVDPSFVPPPDSASTNFISDLALLPNGSMVTLDYQFHQQARWLDAAGTPLPSFNGGLPLQGVTAVLALPDTTVLLRGDFTLNGTHYQGTVKVTATGAVDPAFTFAPGLLGYFTAAQPDGTILFREAILGGGPRLRRLLPTGSLDLSFAPVQFGTGYGGESDEAWVFQSTGDLVVAGGFTTVNGIQRPTLVRLTNIPTGLRAEAAATRPFDVFPNPARATLTLHRATAAPATATLVDVLGRTVRNWPLTTTEQTVPLAGVPAGTYVVRIAGTDGALTRRVVVQP